MGDTMLDILGGMLPLGLVVTNVKEKSLVYTITFESKGDKATADLPKTCAPGCHTKVCKQCIATAMSTIMMNRGNLSAASTWLEWPYKKEPSLNMSVCKMCQLPDGKFIYHKLYENIETMEDAYLLSQLAMYERDNTMDLIFIFPGNNIGINNDKRKYEEALELKEIYKETK